MQSIKGIVDARRALHDFFLLQANWQECKRQIPPLTNTDATDCKCKFRIKPITNQCHQSDQWYGFGGKEFHPWRRTTSWDKIAEPAPARILSSRARVVEGEEKETWPMR